MEQSREPGYFKFKVFYVNRMVITRENHLITLKNITKKSMHIDNKTHQKTNKKINKEQWIYNNNRKTHNDVAIVCLYQCLL